MRRQEKNENKLSKKSKMKKYPLKRNFYIRVIMYNDFVILIY